MASMAFRDSGDFGYDEVAAGAAPAAAPLSGLAGGAGALMSLVLIVGLAVWGYRLALRDVAGVPVIRALEGPSRMAPADPGGELARHIGLSVNAVAARGVAGPVPDQVLLAPPPVALAEEDMPMAALAPLPAPSVAAVSAPTSAAAPPTPAMLPSADLPAASVLLPPEAAENPDAVILALAEAMAYSATLAPLAHAATPSVAPPPVPASVPGVALSPRPQPRPAGLALALATPNAGVDLAPEALTPGLQLAQIGAFDSAALARAEWDRVASRFGALMAGKNRVILEASSAGTPFYRLRVAGFADTAEARQFCAALQAEQTNCVPAQVF